jgi:hypothetical protein
LLYQLSYIGIPGDRISDRVLGTRVAEYSELGNRGIGADAAFIFFEKWYTESVMEALKEIIEALREKLPHLREYL